MSIQSEEDISRIKGHLASIDSMMRSWYNKNHKLCPKCNGESQYLPKNCNLCHNTGSVMKKWYEKLF